MLAGSFVHILEPCNQSSLGAVGTLHKHSTLKDNSLNTAPLQMREMDFPLTHAGTLREFPTCIMYIQVGTIYMRAIIPAWGNYGYQLMTSRIARGN